MSKEEEKEIVKAFALAGLPLILSPLGTALQTLANECFNSSARMRQDEWMEALAKRIDEQDETFAEKIRNTQNFASLFANAQNGALTDIEADKVGLYANVFINAIKNEKMEDTKKHIFLNMLREFTKLHIDILKNLKVIQNLLKEKDNIQTAEFIIKYFKNNVQDIKTDAVFKHVLMDLNNKNCCEIFMGIYFDDEQKTERKILTDIGEEFLTFISEQEKTNG